jgi:hypothetical protein
MRQQTRSVAAFLGLCVAGAFAASGAGKASLSQDGAILNASGQSGLGSAGCASPAPRRATPFPLLARASTPHTYDDYIEDVRSAPDICQLNAVTNDNIAITFGMHVHDRSAFVAGDGYGIFLDTDSNAATGSGPGSGAPAGTEYAIEILDGSSDLRHWNGSLFEVVTPSTPILTKWIDGYGPVLQIVRTDLGDVQSLKFVFMTSNAEDHDLAPDAGTWSYTLSPLTLEAGPLSVGPAKAGRRFAARMVVSRSDLDGALDEGAIQCAANVGGKRLAGRGAFADEHVGCTWRLPTQARGKRLVGGVAVTFQGVMARRAFNVRVT